jgi:hypothetical protein
MKTPTVITNGKAENDTRCKGKGNIVPSIP